MAQLGFQANQYQPTDDFAPLPAGEYTTMMTEANVENTVKGGAMVKITYTVIEGEYQGRKIWSQHNIVNHSPQAEEIGRREISRIAHAIGHSALTDTEQLLNQMVRVSIIIEQDLGYIPKNEIKRWESADGNSSVVYQSQPPQSEVQSGYESNETTSTEELSPHSNATPPKE